MWINMLCYVVYNWRCPGWDGSLVSRKEKGNGHQDTFCYRDEKFRLKQCRGRALRFQHLVLTHHFVKTTNTHHQQNISVYGKIILRHLLSIGGKGWLIGISGSLMWSETLMELIFNSSGEFWCSPEGPLTQIHFPHLHAGAPGIFSDLLKSVQMLKREWVRKATGSHRTY